ncbi:hypothetical protein [Nitrosomonas supralitoralis]|uniref:hypothetical protein n=1 Tax=Nitrosomonas supralitoralis TaxID=2116706 RepID=UPI0011C38CED|nr:hypothetical protein [Nitrosomonas supralitoralis]
MSDSTSTLKIKGNVGDSVVGSMVLFQRSFKRYLSNRCGCWLPISVTPAADASFVTARMLNPSCLWLVFGQLT